MLCTVFDALFDFLKKHIMWDQLKNRLKTKWHTFCSDGVQMFAHCGGKNSMGYFVYMKGDVYYLWCILDEKQWCLENLAIKKMTWSEFIYLQHK